MPGRTGIRYKFETHQSMKLGRLQMIGRVPTLPGDSISIKADSAIRMHPLRRPGAIEMLTELFAFWVPLRWTYPDLVAAATEGWNGNTSYALNEQSVAKPEFLLSKKTTFPRHWLQDYVEILNHFFRERHTPEIGLNDLIQIPNSGEDAETATQEQLDIAKYGYLCWQLESWETGSNWDDAHATTTLPTGNPAVDATSPLTAKADMPALDLARYVAAGRDEQMRQWNAVRVEEIYDQTYEGKLDPEAVKVPHLLMHQNSQMNERAERVPGSEVQGVELTQAASYTTGMVPRRFIAEHGTIYIFSLTRMRPTYRESVLHFLDDPALFANWKLLGGHPVGNEERPYAQEIRRLFEDATGSDWMGYRAYYDWYRAQSDFWGEDYYETDKGWAPRPTPANKNALRRHPNYDDIFLSNQFGNGQIHSRINVQAARIIGMPTDSVKMGSLRRS